MKIKLMFLLFLIVVTLLGCAVIDQLGEPRYYALSFSGEDPATVWNLNRYSILLHSDTASNRPTALMAQAGDLLFIEKKQIELYYRYNPKDGTELSFTYDPDAPFKTYLNGRLISLDIYDDPALWEWIDDIDVRSLRNLRSLHFEEGEQEGLNLAHVQKLADIWPTTGLIFAETDDPSEILALFTPSWLVVNGLLDVSADTLPRLQELECLSCYTVDGVKFIEELPKLENLILFAADEYAVLRFDGLTKLNSLSLFGFTDISGLETISNKNRLRNIFLISCNEIEDMSPIALFPKLTGLGFFDCESAVDLSELQNLSHLRWFSFPPEVTQAEFSKFLSQHQELKVIDLLECHEINDLSPLARLTGIQGLTLDVAVDDLSPLYQLTDMEVLTLDEDSFDEEEYESLQAALPDTQMAVSGYCLGSGWILLIIPIVTAGCVVMRFCRRRSSR